MSDKSVVESTEEQAVASWIGYLNEMRLDRLIADIRRQDINLSDAMIEMNDAMKKIQEEIAKNRGGKKGIHGFIAEAAEEGISNARANIIGKDDVYNLLDDNSPVDLMQDDIPIQMKFSIKNLSLDAIFEHHQAYPYYLENGEKYMIPKDQYEKIKDLLSISEEQANKLKSSDGSFSLKQWKYVHDFFENGDIDFDSVKPSVNEYKDVQVGKIDETLQREQGNLKEIDKKQRSDAQHKSKGTVHEGVAVTVASAAIEGSTALLMAISEKKKSGKEIKDFDSDDWAEILQEAGMGTVKGTVRGSATYILTNTFNNSFEMVTEEAVEVVEIANRANAAAVSAMVTAAFGVAEQAHLYRDGGVTQQEFIENSEMLCADAAVSALSAYIGQIAIPIPVLGSIIGNAIGTTLYKIAKDGLNDKEQKLIQEYIDEIDEHSRELDEQYRELVESVRQGYDQYLYIIESLYAVDVKEAFEGSVSLAKYCGVPVEEILETKGQMDSFFQD